MAIRRKAKKDPVEVLKKEKDKASLYRDEAAEKLEEIEPRVTRSRKKEAGGKKTDPTGLPGPKGGKRRGG